MPLPQVMHNSCQSCVIAQARWMLGLSDETGQRAVRHVDAAVGRGHDAPVAPAFCMPLLLAGGCEVIRYGKPDIDLARLDAKGLAYFREYYADDWPDGAEEFWTPARLSAYRDRVAREHALIDALAAQYPGRLAKAGQSFSLAAADELVRSGWLIMTSYVPEDAAPDEAHVTLLYQCENDGFGDVFRAYTPMYGHPGGMFWRHDQFGGMLRPFADAVRRCGFGDN